MYLSEEEFNKRLEKIQKQNEGKERKLKLKEERKKYGFKFKLPSTSKLILLTVFALCIELLVYCEYAMLVLNDASAMYVLIGIPATLIPTIISYYSKAKAENTKDGLIYDKAMFELNQDSNLEEFSG